MPPPAAATASPPPPFAHGVASFDPDATGVLLWTCVRDGDGRGLPGPVRWVVADAPVGGQVLAAGTTEADVPAGGVVVVDVCGLPPGTTAWYWFEHDGRRSPVGRTRTLPDGPAEQVRLGVVCCSDLAKGPLDVYRALAEHEVDLVVHLGDYVYADSSGDRRPTRPGHDAVTLADYRARYASYRRDGDLQALHQAHPVVAVWDDHDLADNAWRGGAKGHDPTSQGPWAARAAAAVRARHEWLPSRAGLAGQPDRLWRSLALGDLAELVVTDTRWWGRTRDPDGGGPDDPDRDLLGEDQWAWLEERLADPSRPWALVASGVVVDDLTVPMARGRAAARWLPAGWTDHEGRLVRVDQWDGFPASRRRLVRALAERPGDAVVLAGDIHASMAFEGPCDADGVAVAVEWVCPPVLSTPLGRLLPVGAGALAERLGPAGSALRWCDLTSYGFLVVEVRAAAVSARWFGVEPGRDQHVAAAPLGSWEVRRGQPGRLHRLDDVPLDVAAPPFAPGAILLPPRPAVAGVRPRRSSARLAAGSAVGLVGLVGAAAAARWRIRRGPAGGPRARRARRDARPWGRRR